MWDLVEPMKVQTLNTIATGFSRYMRQQRRQDLLGLTMVIPQFSLTSETAKMLCEHHPCFDGTRSDYLVYLASPRKRPSYRLQSIEEIGLTD